MKLLCQPRQTGKTEELLKISSETKYPIITRDKNEAKLLSERAKKEKLNIPEPLSIRDAMNTRLLGNSKVLIDDADFVLSYMIRELCGVEIDTIAMVSRDKEGYEMLPDGRSSKDIINGGI